MNAPTLLRPGVLLTNVPDALDTVLGNDHAMAPARINLANSRNAAFRHIVIGNSLEEGLGAGTINLTFRDLHRVQIQAANPVDGLIQGAGYTACAFVSTSLTSAWTTAGTPAVSGGTTACPGLKFITLINATQSATLVWFGTDADLCYHSDVTGSSLVNVTTDGTPVQTNFNTKTAPNPTTGASGSGKRVTMGTGLALGFHTTVVSFVSGSSSFIGGAMIYGGSTNGGTTNPRTTGHQYWDFSHGGNQVIQFLSNGGSLTTPVADALNNTYREIAVIQPHLIDIELGRNDDGNAVGVAVYKARLLTFIAGIKAQLTAGTYTIRILGMYPAYDSTTWEGYFRAARDVAAADPTCVFVDCRIRTLDFNAAGSLVDPNGLLWTDSRHLSTKGNAVVADILTRQLIGSAHTPISAAGIVAKFTGTADGAHFLRDDGTLAIPAGAGSVTTVSSTFAGLTVATPTTTPALTPAFGTTSTTFMRGDDTRVTSRGFFGDGSDGSATISSPTSLTSDKNYTSLTVNSTLTTTGYRVCCTGTVSGTGNINANGSAASGATAGAGITAAVISGGAPGGNGGTGNGTTGTVLSSAALGGAGAAGGAGVGGRTGGAAGTVSVGAGSGNYRALPMSALGIFLSAASSNTTLSTTIAMMRGGGGGGGGGGDGTNSGGGGGGGGHIVIVNAYTIDFSGGLTITATGGAGANGVAGNSGGGSGGGGGVVFMNYVTRVGYVGGTSATAAGGAAGSAVGAGAANGSAGSAGLVVSVAC